jgi:hypothetical protein
MLGALFPKAGEIGQQVRRAIVRVAQAREPIESTLTAGRPHCAPARSDGRTRYQLGHRGGNGVQSYFTSNWGFTSK